MKSAPKIYISIFVAFAFFFVNSSFSFAEDISPIWQLDIGNNAAPNSYYMEIDEDGSLFVAREGKLLKISEDGEKLWEYEIPQKYQRQISGSPKIAGDFIVITSGYFGGYAYFINKETGQLVTEHQLFDPLLLGRLPYYYSKPALSLDNSRLYIHFTYPEYLFGFNTDTGEMFGKKFISESIGGPAYAPQIISYSDVSYIGTLNGTAYSFYPWGFLDEFTEGDIDLLNFAKDPSPSMVGSLYLVGPAIDYKSRKLYYFDKYGAEGAAAVVVLNLGDGTLLDTISLTPTSLDSKSPPVLDRFGNVFQMTYDKNPIRFNKLFKISPAGEIVAEHTFSINSTALTAIVIDKEGSIYTGVDKLYKFSNDLEEIFSYNLGSSASGMAPLLTNDSSALYAISRDGVLFKLPTNYADPGCIRDSYCDSAPKHNPIIFVHGLGGKDTDWLTGNKAKMRDLILESYQEDDPEFPGNWAYAYHYGYDDQGKYNYQGDIRQIAKGLQEDVARLSFESLEAGGSGKVDLVGFSLGGQIIREYFAQMVRDPSKTMDDRPHKIDKAVIIASPNKGSSYLEIKQNIGALPNLVISTIGDAILLATNDNGQPVKVNSLAMDQLRSSSNFLKRVSSRVATDANFYTLYGDIGFTNRVDFFGVSVGGRASVGDGLVEAASGREIPGIVTKNSFAFGDNIGVEARVSIKNTYAGFEIKEPNILTSSRYIHRALIEQPEIHNKVLEILTTD